MGKILGTAQIQPRGVITIPKEVREFLKLESGDKVALLWENGKVIIKREKVIHEDFELSKD